MNPVSLYINIPFCSSFCDYCDFYSELIPGKLYDESKIDLFLSSVITDIKNQIEYYNVEEIPTVFIGGGTPSLLGKRISVLFDALKTIKGFSPDEFTVEANPASLTNEFLDACREGGVNRLSLGIQTFYEPSRFAVNRSGTVETLDESLRQALIYFGESLSVDMMTGLPYQTEKIIQEDIAHLLKYKPAHISLYSLIIENDTPLEEKLNLKKIILPDNETADAMWFTGCEALKNAGYEHYEVSNFAFSGKKCLHNIRYWKMESWLGAGPAASGTIINEKDAKGIRYTYPSNLNDYLGSFSGFSVNKRPWLNFCDNLSKKELIKETLLMGYRISEGPDKNKFRKRFNLELDDCIPKTLKRWRNKDTMLFLNNFLSEAFTELENIVE